MSKSMMRFVAVLSLALPAAALAEGDPMPVANPAGFHWKAKDALPPGAFGAVVHGDPTKGDYDFFGRFPDHFTVPLHFHTYDCSVVMVKGAMTIARPGRPDVRIEEGGYFLLPAKMPYVARCDSSCTFLVHGAQPFDIIYSDPKDDPRKTVGARP